jgi:hypothetical protein
MIKILKLSTSEEIIGKVIKDPENNSWFVVQPCAITLISSQSTMDRHAMGLVPYAGYTSEHTVSVRDSKVVWIADPAPELLAEYNKAMEVAMYFANDNTPNR